MDNVMCIKLLIVICLGELLDFTSSMLAQVLASMLLIRGCIL